MIDVAKVTLYYYSSFELLQQTMADLRKIIQQAFLFFLI